MCAISAEYCGDTRLKCDLCVAAKIRIPLSAAPWSRNTGSHALKGDHVRKVAVASDGTPTFNITGIGDTRKVTRPWDRQDDPILKSTSKAAGIAPAWIRPSPSEGFPLVVGSAASSSLTTPAAQGLLNGPVD